MSTNQSTSGSDGREFYAPATFQFTRTPGRIERTLARLFRQRGAMTGRPRPDAAGPWREFYAPATFQFSTAPGRVERLATGLIRQRGAMDGHPRPDETAYDFYAPATVPAAFGRRPRGRRPDAR